MRFAAPIVAVAGLALAGCSTTKFEEQISAQEAEISDLQQENAELKSRVAQKEATLADMRQRLSEKPKEVIVEKPAPAPARPAAALEQAGFKVDERAEGTAVVLESGILFESGQAALTAAGKATIEKLLRVLKAEYPARRIRIEGHTDNQAIRYRTNGFRNNWELSFGRAKSVLDVLTGGGVPATRLSIGCYADTKPRSTNASEAGRKENRRVEVLLER
jgi:chemotaxis protein MotB